MALRALAMHRENAFGRRSGANPKPENSSKAFHQSLVRPMHHELTRSDQEHVVKELTGIVQAGHKKS